MRNFLPFFIYEKYKSNKYKGSFKSITMFLDISGFTPMTEELMKHGKEGAEILSGILNRIFEPVIDLVYKCGGFVSGFAGDAITVIFPNVDPLLALECAVRINKIFEEKGLQKSRYGDFKLYVKLGLSYGEVEWGIVGHEKHKTYYFSGQAIDGCAGCEHQCEKMDIVIDKALYGNIKSENINDIEVSKSTDTHFKLLKINKEINIPNDTTNYDPDKDILKIFLPENILEHKQIGEFRNIVSVFVSFKDITTFDELSGFMGEVIDIMDIFGGYFNSLDFGDKGSNMLIFFGAPVSYETNIERAINFIHTVKSKHKDTIRAGIVFGIVYAGIVGSDRRCAYTCLGDTVNLSARFMMKADWGSIWITKKISDKIDDLYSYKFLGAKEFKGKSKPIDVYELDEKKHKKIYKPFDGQFIGRQEELRKTINFCKKIYDGVFAGVITLYGDAGVGKSRLIFEVLKEFEDKSEIFIFQTDNILKKSLNPFVDFLELYFHQAEMNTNSEKKAQFENIYDDFIIKLKRSAPTREDIISELERTKSIIGALLGHYWEGSLYEVLDSKGRFENTLYALKNFIIANSIIEPLILHIEDTHNIDEDSLKLIEVLTRNIKEYPIVLLCSSRFNDDGSKPVLIADDEVSLEEISLKNFSENDVAEYIKATLGEQPDSKTLAFINSRSQGNPFYIEQFCMYLKEKHLIELKNGKYVLKDITMEVPSSINAILMSRIDRLSNEVKETAQVASVLGREFDVDILLNLIEFLNSMVSKDDFNELVYYGKSEKLWASVSEIKYIFQHALLHETIYEMQLKQRLKVLHASAGKIMEDVCKHDESKYIETAYHYEKSESYDNAKKYYYKAGEYLKKNYRNTEAVRIYQKLIKYSDEETELMELYYDIAQIYNILSSWDTAITYINKSVDIAKKLGNEDKEAHLKYLHSSILKDRGDFNDAQKLIDEVRKIAEDIYNNELISDSHNIQGSINFLKGDLDVALEEYSKALHIREEINNKMYIADTLGNMGNVYMYKGDLNKAVEYQEDAVKYRKEIDDKIGLIDNLNSIGVVYQFKGDMKTSIKYFEEALELAEKLGRKNMIAMLMNSLGVSYFSSKRFTDAHKYYQVGLDINKDIGDKRGTVHNLEGLGNVFKFNGEYEKALSYYDKALDTAEKIDYQYGTSNLLIGIGNVYYELEDYTEAVKCYNKSIKVKEAIGNLNEIGYPYTYLAYCCSNSGKYRNALEIAVKHLLNIKETSFYAERGRTHLAVANVLSKIENGGFNDLIDQIGNLSNIEITPESFYEEAVKISSEVGEYIETLIPAYFDYGKYLYSINKKDQGLEKINKAKELSVRNNMNGEYKKIENFLENI